MEENKIEYFLDENGDNLNLEIEAPIVRAIPIQKSLNWRKFNDSAKAYLSGVPIQGLYVDPNSKYSKSWAHNVNSFAKAVAENQSYTISPYKQYTATDLHELARYFNNFDLNTSKIDFGNIKPKKLVKDYVKDHPEVSEETQQELLEQFKRLKVNEQTNKRTFKTARRYAGSDQQYKEDRKFYEDLGERGALIAAAIPAGYVAAAALTGAAYTAPYWGPWVAKNIVLPYLGGKVVNGATKWITDGKYNSFGDWAYNETPLNEWTEGTWLEEPTRFATDMLNPGYWAPYNKITKWAGPRIGKFIDGIKWKAYNEAGNLVGTQIYKNPKAIKSAENIFQMIPKQHRYSFAQGVINGNKTAASNAQSMIKGNKTTELNAQNSSQWFTTEGMPNPKTTFYSGFPINSSNNSFNIFHSFKGTGQFINDKVRSVMVNWRGNRIGSELSKIQFQEPIYRTGYHVTRYAGDGKPYLFPDQYVDDLGNTIKLDNYNPVRNPDDNLPINTYWLGGDEINFASARPEIGLHVGATESPGRILMSRQYGSRRTVPPVVREVTWIDYPNSTRTMPDMKRWIASSENKKLWEDIGITIDNSMLEDDLYKSFNGYYDNSTTRNIEALNKSNALLNTLRRAGITSIKYGNKYEIPWGWKHIEGNFYSLPTGRKIEWPGGESHAIITPESWWSKNRRFTPTVNTDISNTIAYDDLYKSVTRFDNFLKNTPQSLKLSDYELNNVRLFRKWLKKNSLINPDTYTDEQLAYALQNRRNKLINQSNNNFVSIVEQINSKPYIRTFRNEYPIGNVTLQDLGDEMRIGYIEKEILDQKLTTPYTVLGLDASINVANQLKKSGVRTGELLLSPQHTLKHTTPSNYNYSIPITRHGQPKMGEYKDKSNMYRDLTISEDSDLLSGSVGYITRSLSPKHRGNLEQWLNRDGVVILKGNKYYDLNNYPGYKYFSPIKVLHSYPQRPFQHNVKSTFFDPMKIKYNENGEMLIDWDNTDLFYKCGGKLIK